jgi:PAS domain S-box-containing protein
MSTTESKVDDISVSLRMIHFVNEIMSNSLIENSPKDALNVVLKALLDLTNSEYGFVGEIMLSDSGTRFLRSYAVTDISWNSETKELYEQYITTGIDFHNLETLFGKVIKTGNLMIANDPAQHPDRGGTPAGHPPLKRFLGIPLYHANVFVGMVGLANRPEEYTREIVERLRPVTAAGAMMITALRVQREKDRVAAELERLRQRNSELLNIAPSAVVCTDEDGNIVLFNKAAESLFGWSEPEVVGKPVNELIVPERLRLAHQVGLARHRTTGETRILGRTVEVPALHKDGREMPVEISLTRGLDAAKSIYMASFSDLTLRKRTEEALIRARELAEEANRAKMGFLAVVSHEIRTPLASIQGVVELLARSERLDNDEKGYLLTLQTATESLMSVLGDVLDMSKIDAGRMEVDAKPFNPRVAITDSVSSFVLQAKDKGLVLDVGKLDDLPEIAISDAGKFKQVLGNLLSNAIKFTFSGNISISASYVAESAEAGRLVVSVLDSGVGITKGQLSKIFDSFVQVDASLSRSQGGVGLGLTICKRLCELMGGGIEVQSSVGQGSRFNFWIRVLISAGQRGIVKRQDASMPSVKEESARIETPVGKSPSPGKASSAQGRTVLIVDDNLSNQLILQKQLEMSGYSVRSAASGMQALQIMESEHLDIVLLDLEMPVMSGPEVAKRHRAREAKLDRPALFGPVLKLVYAAR